MQRTKVLEEIKKTVELYGFTARELGIAVRKSAKAVKAVTYRDASDPNNVLEWNGEVNQKGRKPQWILDHIKNGTIKQFRVAH